MLHSGKWRDTIDPFSLKYDNFKLTEILDYPHAGNEVFHVRVSIEAKAQWLILRLQDIRIQLIKLKLT